VFFKINKMNIQPNAQVNIEQDYGAPPGFGEFSRNAQDSKANAELGKSVNDYILEFQEQERLQDLQRSSGIDPRGYSSRALQSLKNLLGGDKYYGANAETQASSAENLQQDVMNLLDPVAWVPNQTQVQDPGGFGGEFANKKNLEIGRVYTTKDGKAWRFVGQERGFINKTGGPGGTPETGMVNKFEYVSDSSKTKEAAEGYRQLMPEQTAGARVGGFRDQF
jgi:hypothetical protein